MAEELPTLTERDDEPKLFLILQSAVAEAKKLGHASVDPAHLLLALLGAHPTTTADVLKKAGFEASELRPQLLKCLSRK